ncbi:plancitoxin-1-like [Mercenaria mercenaria]|uniref:plancitoxin-1-like n=1 Tax=Mercenaria mercenaria TaxID=6596 RepID=UPI00234E8E45|nr:plancitoxin-1-like [Mercenaria mercenaria]
MAGTRKELKTAEILFFLVLFVIRFRVNCLNCLSQDNEPIDWFIAYKLPGSEKDVPKNSFFYMDAKSPAWTLSPKTLEEKDQAIYNTLNQIYRKQSHVKPKNVSSHTGELLYLMYNDEGPEHKSEGHGHTKGVIAFDSKNGFWLVHSTPKFPPSGSEGYSWPSSADIYGQSFLCISMETEGNVNEIGHQLLFNYPYIYDKNIPSFASRYPNMTDALKGKHVTEEPWYRETKLTSTSGVVFHSFAKYSKFNADLYSDMLAPRFESTLLVETWQNGRGKMCSNCTGKYKVFNIATLDFKQRGMMFKETQDHSKWVVTNSTTNVWTCIGDINRQMSQMERPGGTVCFQNKSVWQNFHNLIILCHNCGPYKKCISP